MNAMEMLKQRPSWDSTLAEFLRLTITAPEQQATLNHMLQSLETVKDRLDIPEVADQLRIMLMDYETYMRKNGPPAFAIIMSLILAGFNVAVFCQQIASRNRRMSHA